MVATNKHGAGDKETWRKRKETWIEADRRSQDGRVRTVGPAFVNENPLEVCLRVFGAC
jgi:hypothetical protein